MRVNQPDHWRTAGRVRRLLVLAGLGAAADLTSIARPARATESARAAPVQAMVFPRDHGSHPERRTEWWYITGHASVGTGAQTRDYGFQLTFFRARVEATQQMASRFAARHLLFAHAALTDVQGRRFWHDQRIAREGFDVARASAVDTDLRLRDWSLQRVGDGYHASIAAAEFTLELRFTRTQPLLLQGTDGISRKGPQSAQYSHYYSQPQLAFEGAITLAGQRVEVAGDGARRANAGFVPGRGAAWLDHEWSDSLLHPDAVGWDWIGMNLFDGSALTAFRIRDKSGNALWDGGSLRRPGIGGGNAVQQFSRGAVVFQPTRSWTSPLTQASYPVEWLLRTPAGQHVIKAMLDQQELDSRRSTGAVYWEGLSDLLDDARRPVGRGYLEMTGYAKPLVL